MKRIYLDANATTAVHPDVIEAMRSHWSRAGNPESRHAAGREARRAWDEAAQRVAHVLGAEPDEVVFTSGGTESNSLAILGLAERDCGAGPGRILTSSIEHPAVSEPLERLAARGWTIDRATVGGDGITEMESYRFLLGPETRFATLMLANNETGALQPVRELVELARGAGIAVHTDAVQAVGRVAVDFGRLGVDLLAASAHKLHGPCGIGVLLVRRGLKLVPLMVGGGQQRGLRAGTCPVALAVGMATALEIWQREMRERTERWQRLRERFVKGLTDLAGEDVCVWHGPTESCQRLPQTLYLGLRGLDANVLLIQLDLNGVCASLGSACASGSTRPSPTLTAMGVEEELARCSIRFSLDAFTSEAEIDEVIERFSVLFRSMAIDLSSYG